MNGVLAVRDKAGKRLAGGHKLSAFISTAVNVMSGTVVLYSGVALLLCFM